MSTSTDIDTQAAEWLIRRDRAEDDDEQRRAFERWLAEDARHRRAYLELQSTWRRADELKTWLPPRGEVNPKLLQRYGSTKVFARFKRWPSFAAAAALVLAIISGGYLRHHSLLPVTYITEVGSYQRIVLQDGSTLQLNTDSKARVLFDAKHRRIELLRGEAYFQVAADAARPFEVIAAQKAVRALGTAFIVRVRDKGRLEVVVTEGKVSLGDDGRAGKEVLIVRQSARVDATHTTIRSLTAPETTRRLAWQSGELSFQGETLDTVVAEFNRYNRRQLHLADPALAALHVGGDFRATDLESFVAALQRSFDLRADVLGERIDLNARGSE